jgi:Phasin protein
MGAKAAQALSGAKEIGELAMGLAERNIPSSFEFAQRLLQAKDPRDGGAACGLR